MVNTKEKQRTFLWKKVCSVDSEKLNLWTIIQGWMMEFEYNENMFIKRKDKANKCDY